AHNIGKYGNYAGSGYTDMEFFSEMMNEKAERIGCVNSNFTNAHGLLEADSQKPLELKNWSCAYDLAMIAKYAYENHEMFRELFGNSRYEMPANDEYPGGYVLRNSNLLVRVPTESEGNIYFREYAVGGKTGGLDEYFLLDEDGEWVEYGGIANLVSVADDGENTYITVTLEAPYKTGELDDGNGNRMSRLHYAYADHLAIYEWLVQ
ncbi:MAG: hypothetical protein FWF82_04290, partial [Oscillospiraceae bacterium]|nr:hypothetical protein [Oscillospiraceae bacterium]